MGNGVVWALSAAEREPAGVRIDHGVSGRRKPDERAAADGSGVKAIADGIRDGKLLFNVWDSVVWRAAAFGNGRSAGRAADSGAELSHLAGGVRKRPFGGWLHVRD